MPVLMPDRIPTVLIACTTHWDFPARVAMGFAEIGWRVEAVCCRGQRLEQTRAVSRTHRYHAIRPLARLAAVIERTAPDLVVPCDDRAHRHLQALRERLPAIGRDARAALLTRSLGSPNITGSVLGRADFIALAKEAGVRAPLTLLVQTRDELQRALEKTGLPAMLKVDETWGGSGVAVADTPAQAAALFECMSCRLTLAQALKRLVVNREPFLLETWFQNTVPRVNVQAFVAGKPANCVVACQAGEVLAIIQVEVERTQREMGPAAIVRVIENAEIADAARRVVRRLGLSGFIGLDFMVDPATNVPHLIEMNQRMTPTGHLALSRGRDPIGALTAAYLGLAKLPRSAVTEDDVIALFPAAWRGEPDLSLLGMAYLDIPWEDPILVRALASPPWQERGWLARLEVWLGRPGIAPANHSALARRLNDVPAWEHSPVGVSAPKG